MARKVVWGIDIGQTALRAVKGSLSGDRIEVLAFDTVEYEETLSAPDVDKDNAIQRALRTFLTRNHISSNDVVLACIPGQSALIRFIKLPPVEKKRIPDIVRYEAHQQIPFPLEEVVWDYKPLEKVYGPGEQVEVGIFAMRRDIVHGFLSNLMVCGLDVDMLQLAPMALYNFVAYDRPGGTEATIVIDMGAENTELLIYTGTSVWPRSLPISGNDFTEAIMEKFKVPFGKAETLKHMAMQSKYSKQIYQAIEPALRRLVEEVQRSVGYYKSINPGTRISGILALGGSFKLPGLGKYVSENLQHMPIRNLTDPQNFDMSVARNPRVFEESALSFGVALGLLVQGCGLAGMGISLLPQELLQRKIIARKKPWAAAVAVCALVMFGTAYTSTWRRGKELSEANSDVAKKFVDNADKLQDRYTDLTNVTVTKEKLEQIEKLWTGRDFWLYGLRKIFAPVPPEPENEKGVWYRKVVSDTVDFETVAEAMAQGVTDAFPSLGFRAKGMELEAGWREKVTSRVRKPDLQLIEFNPALGQPAKRTAPVQKIQRPDVIYMVIQGETTDLGAGVYVTNTLVKNLTNVWQCTKCKVVLRGMEPPEKCPTPDCTGTRGDFKLEEHSRPLIQDVRFVASQQEERFVDHMDRVVGIETLGEDTRKTWENILHREVEIKAGALANWTAAEKPGEEPLPKREKFLAKLEQERGVRVELFTDFEITFFLDPSGDLMDEAAKRKKAVVLKAGTGLQKTGQN